MFEGKVRRQRRAHKLKRHMRVARWLVESSQPNGFGRKHNGAEIFYICLRLSLISCTQVVSIAWCGLGENFSQTESVWRWSQVRWHLPNVCMQRTAPPIYRRSAGMCDGPPSSNGPPCFSGSILPRFVVPKLNNILLVLITLRDMAPPR